MNGDLDPLRYSVLRYFLEHPAEQTSDLLLLPSVQTHPHKLTKQMVYSMSMAGLVDQFGSRSGTTYVTNRMGFVVLATMRRSDENWPYKPPFQTP